MRLALVLVLAVCVGGWVGLRQGPPAEAPEARAAPPPTRTERPQVAAAPLHEARPAAEALTLLALARNAQGRPYARLRDAAGQVRSLGVGDSPAPGLRLAAIEPRAVEIEQGRQRWRLSLPPEAAALPAPVAPVPVRASRFDDPAGPIAVAADAPLPSSTRLERAIQRASRP